MEVEQVSLLPVSSFRAVLEGPSHVYSAANHDYLKLVGHRDLFNMPIRDALPELVGQGYYELLGRVYATNQIFIGQELQLRLQPRPSAPLEDHLIDLVYLSIQNEKGKVLGLFVEGCDRTQSARA
jgi:hypothetical protein